MKVEKTWGYEEILYNGDYCCKKLVYTKPISSSLHYHPKKHETFVVASGKFEIEIAWERWFASEPMTREIFGPGDGIVLTPGTRHRVRCIEPGTIVEASTHDDPKDCVRLEPSES